MTHNLRNFVQAIPNLFTQKKISPMQIFGIILLLCIPIIELASLYSAFAGKIGVICWILLWIYLALFTIRQTIALVKTSVHHRLPFVLLTIGLFLFLCATNVSSIYSINGENTQEISCALAQITNSPDWGYRQTCLFGYPTRQFIVPSLPSLLFGNSLAALNIGGVIYFAIGLILFCRGIQVYFDDSKKGDALILLLLGSLLHFYYINHFLFIFEQSIFPLSFALAGCGVWLMYLRTKSHLLLIPLTLLLYAGIFSYTPSLVLIPLAYGAILWQTLQNQTHRFKILTLIVVILTALMTLSSFTFRSDIKLGHQYPGGTLGALNEIGLAIKHLAIHIFPKPFTTWVMIPIFFILILTPLSGILGRIPQLIALWCIGVFCVSIYARGFSYYHIEFRMHRSMVMLPVLLALWVYVLNKYRKHVPLALILLAAFCMTLSGLHNYKTIQLARPISQQYKFLQWLMAQQISQLTTLYLLNAQTPKNNFISIRDISRYFTPHISINNNYTLPADCSVSDVQGIFLLEEVDRCSNTVRQRLMHDSTLTFIATYDGVAGEPLLVFSRTLEP